MAGTFGSSAAVSTPPANGNDLRDDPRVRAFVEAYRTLIDSVSYGEDDAVFTIAGTRIHFRDGRMLAEDRLGQRRECDPIFYRYPLGPLTESPSPGERVTYCTDLLETLWGRTELEIRGHAESASFLGHRLFVNHMLAGSLHEVERDIRRTAEHDGSVRAWIDDLRITYSFVDREIAGSPTRSLHAWGMAVDLVPSSYDGRHVYWRWSQAFDADGWSRIPLAQRWTPPEPVIDIFERHGFVWGGKWPRFDNIHFEYRPEILLYNQILEDDGP